MAPIATTASPTAAKMPGLFLALVFAILLLPPSALPLNQEGLYLLRFKSNVDDPGSTLSDWDPRDSTPCNWTGIRCSSSANVTSISLRSLNIVGPFNPYLCRLPSLTHIDLSDNNINGSLQPSSVLPCSALSHLNLSFNLLVGHLPSTLALLPELRYLDLNGNNFTGDIPSDFGTFPKLQVLGLVGNLLNGTIPPFLGNINSLRELNLSYNPFAGSRIPVELGNLSSLVTLWLSGCNLVGEIPSSLGSLRRLRNLDLSSNNLEGEIPRSITNLSNVFQIELYMNSLSGEIPPGMSNLVSLKNFDASANHLVGNIPSEIFELPVLESFHVYNNNLVGEVPAMIGKAKNLRELRLFLNNLTGSIPQDLGKTQPLVFVDLSQNGFTGGIPPGICDMGTLQFLMLIDNKLSGSIPEGIGRCVSLRRLRLNGNLLSGDIPAGVWGLPQVSLLDLAWNSLTGGISPAISGAGNLSALSISNNGFSGSFPEEFGTLLGLHSISAGNNRFTGSLPVTLSHLSKLEILDLHNNSLSGKILPGIGSLSKLTELNLANNDFTRTIPRELGSLPVLNYLDLSHNLLTGEIPSQLENLKLNIFNFSYNQLSGKIPPLFMSHNYRDRFVGNAGLCGAMAGLCPERHDGPRKKHTYLWIGLIFMVSGLVFVAGMASFYIRYTKAKKAKKAMSKSKWTLTSFHKLEFSELEIVDSLDEDNVIGTGGSGKVYKATLGNGSMVAVKKLWGTSKKDLDCDRHENESRNNSFDAEVATLGKLRHRCIVKLWCCCTHNNSKLLVYEYMPNGSLGDLLHGNKSGILDWPMRYRIALDAAEGFSYLHHDCVPPIVHRDIKSNNILLDADFRAKVSDFGVAKAVETTGNGPKSMSVIAGSCGYIAPEYAYTLRVNEKSDVYSFGMVVLELVTGKRPVEPEFGEKDLAKWVCSTLEQKEVEHVIDPELGISHINEIRKVLDIGLQCTSPLPINRPTMRKVVKMLVEVGDESNGKHKPEKKDGKLSPYYYYYYEDNSGVGSAV